MSVSPYMPDSPAAETDGKKNLRQTFAWIGAFFVCFLVFLMLQFAATNALAGAARSGDVRTVYLMTRVGFSPDMKDLDSGVTPLMEAAGGGHRNVAELLIKRGANVNAEGEYWSLSPLDYALSDDKKDVALLLLEHGAEVNHVSHMSSSPPNFDTPLTIAANDGQLEIVKSLVAHGADVHFRDKNGHDARYRAEFNGHMAVVKFLKHLPK